MKLLIGVMVSFIVGVGCRYFDIPVPSPPVIPGALLVLAMTIGYSATNTILNRKGNIATTSHLCGGPTGASVRSAKVEPIETLPTSKYERANSLIERHNRHVDVVSLSSGN